MKNQTDISLPTLDEIRSYNEGTLNASRTHEIEILSLENPLVADALEGYQAIPAYTAVPDGSHFLQHTASSWWKMAGYTLGVAAVGITAFVLLQPKETNYVVANSVKPHQPEITIQTEPVELVIESKADTLPTVTVNEKPANVSTDNQVHSGEISSDEIIEKSHQPNSSPILISGDLEAGISGRTRYEPELIQLPEPENISETVVIKHIQNYKVVDYGSMRHNAWPPFDIDEIGTPAKYENPNNKTMDDIEVEKAVPYLKFMKQCIESYYKGNYNRCLDHFRVVLEQYPDDANAQFYGGMCYYKKKDYAKAIASFDKSLANITKTFGEEAMFYKAMSLKSLGKQKDACVIFKKIKDSSSFYRHDAKKEYESCELGDYPKQ